MEERYNFDDLIGKTLAQTHDEEKKSSWEDGKDAGIWMAAAWLVETQNMYDLANSFLDDFRPKLKSLAHCERDILMNSQCSSYIKELEEKA